MSDLGLPAGAGPLEAGQTPSPAWGGEAASDPNLGPIIWVVGSSFDRRADMLWENKPCDSDEMVLAVVKDALARNATEIKVRCHPAYTWRMGGEEAENNQ